MNSKERVHAALKRQPVDRVPIFMWFHPGTASRLARELENGDLVRVPVDELEFKRVLRLVHRRQGTLSYAARAFLRIVRTLAQEQGPPFYYHVERAG